MTVLLNLPKYVLDSIENRMCNESKYFRGLANYIRVSENQCSILKDQLNTFIVIAFNSGDEYYNQFRKDMFQTHS